ncbi:integrase core domain-containing protein, partial [Rhodoblastus sphagnicola]|uniref:integrase core domain-containing protein n=1 Tax=Rhodoblastus sphagnicola TaxID=333368 RepID=UPI003CC8D97E
MECHSTRPAGEEISVELIGELAGRGRVLCRAEPYWEQAEKKWIAHPAKEGGDGYASGEGWEKLARLPVEIARWITFYNRQRPHAAHGGRPPAVVYWNAIQPDQQAKKYRSSLSGNWQHHGGGGRGREKPRPVMDEACLITMV